MRSCLLNLSHSRTKRPQVVEPSLQNLGDLPVIALPMHANEQVSPVGAMPGRTVSERRIDGRSFNRIVSPDLRAC